MSELKLNPYAYLVDTKGTALDAGLIYVGLPNQDPATAPIALFYDAALTVAAPNPVPTLMGYAVRNGSPTSVYAAEARYSLRSVNRLGVQVFYNPLVSGVLTDIFNAADYASADAAARAAYLKNAIFLNPSSAAKLVCNPTAGDDIKNMALWCAANHLQARGASLTLEIADGLHNISTFVDITDGKFLKMSATAAPDLIVINAISYVLVSGNTYTATVGLASALPAHVVVGYAVGCQNVKSNLSTDGAQALNGAHIIKTIAPDRLSFTCDLRVYGAAPLPVTPANLNTATTQGLEGCRLVVPKCCLRVDAAGWDGSIQEGWLNALNGAHIDLTWIGMSYNGVTSEHDILFARGQNSAITLTDYCVIAGTGDKIIRSSAMGHFYVNRSCLGGGTTGQEIYQGIGGSVAHFIRCTMGGVSATGLTESANCHAFGTQNIIANTGGAAIRTTYQDATATFVTGRIVHCDFAAQPTAGTIGLAADDTILNCAAAFTIGQGMVYGNPTITNTPNATVANVLGTQGGAWVRDLAPVANGKDQYIGTYTQSVDFSSIASLAGQDITVTAAGVLFNDKVEFVRNNSAIPNQGVIFDAFVSAADQITLRARNVSGAAVDPTAFTARFYVYRVT